MANFGTTCGNGQYGWTTRASDKGFVKFLRTTDITKGQINWDSVPYCQEVPADLEKYQIQLNDILISRAGSVGFSTLINQIPFPTVFASYLIRFMPSIYVEPRYVAYFLRSSEYWQQIAEASSGIALSNINAKKLSEISIPLAPLNEQKRIADKLDLLLDRVDACRERLERVPHILESFRQSVLAAAISGILTESWRKFHNHNLDAWLNLSLTEICLSITDGDHQAPPQATNGIPFITISAINDKRLSLDKATRFVPHSYFDQLKEVRKPQIGDILFSVTGSIAIPALVNTDEPFTFQRHIAILKPNLSLITSKFLFYSLCTEDIKAQSISIATGTAQKTIPLSGLRLFVIAIPSIEEQEEIVHRIDTLFTYADCIETSYQKTYNHLKLITSVLLDKAFRGELASQDFNDEPASVLLDRIRIQRKNAEATVTGKQHRKPVLDKPSQSKLIMLKRKNIQSTHLSDILKKNGSLTPETLWSISQLGIDEFYDQLRDEESRELLKETRKKTTDTLCLLEIV